MDIRVADDYELRAADPLNWQLYERREVKKKDGGRRVEWVGLPSYHRDLGCALMAVAARIPKASRRGVLADLEGAVDELRGIEREIRKHARAFERALAGKE